MEKKKHCGHKVPIYSVHISNASLSFVPWPVYWVSISATTCSHLMVTSDFERRNRYGEQPTGSVCWSVSVSLLLGRPTDGLFMDGCLMFSCSRMETPKVLTYEDLVMFSFAISWIHNEIWFIFITIELYLHLLTFSGAQLFDIVHYLVNRNVTD